MLQAYVERASACKERKGWQHQGDMKEYKRLMTNDNDADVAHENKSRPISTWRRPIGEKVRKISYMITLMIVLT